jgi:L-amino acid N-acyltransferase YncA
MPTDTAYPRAVSIGDSVFTLRPMLLEDRAPLLELARSLPVHDLLFLNGDITDAGQIDAWMRDIGRAENVTILAFNAGRLAGFCSVVRSAAGWTRHVGELRVVVIPELRGRGLGRVLTAEAFRHAIAMGVQKMVAQMTADQEHAIHAFRRLGFHQEAVLHGQVKDRGNQPLDLVIMARGASDEDLPLSPAA